MTNLTLLLQSKQLPRPANPQAAAIGLGRWIETADRTDDPALASFAR
ncbi:MAG: hypothetical protein H5U25_09445, partial [Oceanibaculum nanhaiense]|nr:hypothetical protein [Oceanibaculum nanhaiense]